MMASAESFGREEEVRNLHRMLRVFACKQEDGAAEQDYGERSECSDRTGNETEQAYGHTIKGT